MKKTTAIVFLAFFSWITSQGQESKFKFGINLFPNYSTGIISNDGLTPPEVVASIEEREISKPSFSALIFTEYSLKEKAFIGLGIGYQNNGERTTKAQIYTGYDPVTGTFISDPSFPTDARFVYNHHNIEIPLYFRYVFGNKFFVMLGTSGIVNFSNTISSVFYYENGSKEKNTENDDLIDARRFNISANFGIGMDYLRKDRFSLFIFPYAQYGLLGISKSVNLNRNMLSIGLSTGIRI